MEEKKLKENRKNRKNFDPTKAINDPSTVDLEFQKLPYSQDEKDEYIKAKKECLARGGNWQKERGPKFDKMAKEFSKVYSELESMD